MVLATHSRRSLTPEYENIFFMVTFNFYFSCSNGGQTPSNSAQQSNGGGFKVWIDQLPSKLSSSCSFDRCSMIDSDRKLYVQNKKPKQGE